MSKNKKIAMISSFSSFSIVLTFLGFNLPVLYFIKIDFSEIPAILASFILGPASGIFVFLIRNLFLCLFSKTMGIGELSNFLLQGVFIAFCGFFKKRNFLGFLISVIISSGFNVVLNYFILYPLFFNIVSEKAILDLYKSFLPTVNSLLTCIILVNIPISIIRHTISYSVANFICSYIDKSFDLY